MSEYTAGSIEANGIVVPISVDDHGYWRAEYDGRTQSYDTRDKLETRLKTLTRRSAVKVEVAVIKVDTTYNGATFARTTLTGIHGANGNVLGTVHHGGRRGDVKEQFAKSYASGEKFFGGDVTAEQLAEYALLRRASYEAQQAVHAAEQKYEIQDIKAAVQRAVDLKSGDGSE